KLEHAALAWLSHCLLDSLNEIMLAERLGEPGLQRIGFWGQFGKPVPCSGSRRLASSCGRNGDDRLTRRRPFVRCKAPDVTRKANPRSCYRGSASLWDDRVCPV